MFGQSLLSGAFGGPTCTTDTDQLFPSTITTTSIATYQLNNATTSIPSNTYPGTPSNITYAAGKFGNAAVFNGSSSEISLGSSNSFSYTTTGALSINMWIKTTNTSTAYVVSKANDSSGQYEWAIEQLSNGTLSLHAYTNAGGFASTINNTAVINDGNWHNLVGVIVNNTSTTLYIDGIAATSTSFSGTAASYSIPTLIGHFGGISAATAWFEGDIDQVRIYNRAITAEEVTTLYNEVACPSGLNFNTVLYTGNGTTQNVGGVGFQPDLVWIKERSSGSSHNLADVVRGSTKYLSSNLANPASTLASTITSFDTNGFSVGNDGGVNQGSQTYVAWNWKAGDGAVPNTDGTISSDVSANVAAGFSIISYTGNGVSGATVGHGLESTPQLTFIKCLNQNNTYWFVPVPDIVTGKYLFLNTSSVGGTGGFAYDANNITLNNTFSDANANNNTYIAYAWHSVAGYSKIGSYTGQTSGVTITTGFQPRFIMVKSSSNVENWAILDTVRGSGKVINPNRANAESDSTLNTFAVSSTGFSFPNQSIADAMLNENGYEYIYMAFA